jgi:hypothetical protein
MAIPAFARRAWTHVPADKVLDVSFDKWLELAPKAPGLGGNGGLRIDPCKNHVEMKRFLNRYERILLGDR